MSDLTTLLWSLNFLQLFASTDGQNHFLAYCSLWLYRILKINFCYWICSRPRYLRPRMSKAPSCRTKNASKKQPRNWPSNNPSWPTTTFSSTSSTRTRRYVSPIEDILCTQSYSLPNIRFISAFNQFFSLPMTTLKLGGLLFVQQKPDLCFTFRCFILFNSIHLTNNNLATSNNFIDSFMNSIFILTFF